MFDPGEIKSGRERERRSLLPADDPQHEDDYHVMRWLVDHPLAQRLGVPAWQVPGNLRFFCPCGMEIPDSAQEHSV